MLETLDDSFGEESKIIHIDNIYQFGLSPIEIPKDIECVLDTSDLRQTNHHIQHSNSMLVKSIPMTDIAEKTFVISNFNSSLFWYLILAFCIGIGVGISFQTYS